MCIRDSPHTKFKGEVYILTKEEGGRHTPFFNNYRPQFYFRTTDVTGSIELPAGTEMVMPGDNVTIDVESVSYTHLKYSFTILSPSLSLFQNICKSRLYEVC